MTWFPDTNVDRHGRRSRDPYTIRRDPATTICRAHVGDRIVYSLFRRSEHVACSERIDPADSEARIAAVQKLKQRAEELWPCNQ